MVSIAKESKQAKDSNKPDRINVKVDAVDEDIIDFVKSKVLLLDKDKTYFI